MFKRKNTSKRKRGLFKNIRPGKWVGTGEIYSNARFLKSMLVTTSREDDKTSSAEPSLSFDESLKKNNLAEADLRGLASRSYKLTIVYFVLSCSLLFYAALLFHRDFLLACFCTVSFSSLFLSYSIKECFSYARIKLRKLRVRFGESIKCFFKREVK